MTTRVPLSTNDLLSSANKEEEDESYYSKIPILKRRLRVTTNTNKDNATTKKDPICVIVVGMAGSGKTTLMAQLQKSLSLRVNDDDDVSFCRDYCATFV
jgi:putative ribosome biogenesis GTPase RsgA